VVVISDYIGHTMSSSALPLSAVKARLSEVVRTVRRTGEALVITVDGEPAARVVPVDGGPRTLTPQEAATSGALFDAVARIKRPKEPFDAVELVREGRR
jgi:prevent-host-death family protein